MYKISLHNIIDKLYINLRKAREANFQPKFSFFVSLSTAEAHIFGVKFTGLYGTVVLFISISFWEKAICGVASGLSIPLEGGVTVSNNFTKQRQNGFKIGTSDKFAAHLRKENFTSIEIVIYTIFFTIVDFSIHHVFWAGSLWL